MSCCNCQTTPACKNIDVSDLANLVYVAGVDNNGCPKYQSVGTLIPTTHPAATVTNNAAPFAWNAATQTLNIPKEPTLVKNADGTYTFTPGDGTTPTILPAECCPTLTKNADGSFTFHTTGVSDVIIPAITLTNNDATFSWNPVTRTGNIPKGATLTLNADGSATFDPGNGGASTVIPATTLTNNDAAFSWNPVTRVGNIPQTDRLAANADGSFTMNHGDGTASVTIPLISITNNDAPFAWNPVTRVGNIPQATKVAANLDGSFTVNHGDGTASVTIPAITLTNNAAPFSWNPVTRVGNIPQGAKLVANADGSHTFTPGDGSATVTIPKDCCPTLTSVGSTYIFTNGDGSTVNFTLHPAATLATSAAPFSWNSATQSGNIPHVPSLTLQPGGAYLFTPGDGGATTTIPAANDTYIDNMSIVGQVLTLHRNDNQSFQVTIPTSTSTDTKVVAVSYTPTDGKITITNSDGTKAETIIDICARLQESATGTQGVPGVTKFYGNDCEWHLLPPTAINQLTPLPIGANAVYGTSVVLGNDGLWHQLPALPTQNGTPLSVIDTSEISLTSSGTNGHTLQANLNLDPDLCNLLSISAAGLLAKQKPVERVVKSAPSLSLNDAQIGAFPLNVSTRIQQVTHTWTSTHCADTIVIPFVRTGNTSYFMHDGNSISISFGYDATIIQDSIHLTNSTGGWLGVQFPGTYALMGGGVVPPGGTFTQTFEKYIEVNTYTSDPSMTIFCGTLTVLLLILPQ